MKSRLFSLFDYFLCCFAWFSCCFVFTPFFAFFLCSLGNSICIFFLIFLLFFLPIFHFCLIFFCFDWFPHFAHFLCCFSSFFLVFCFIFLLFCFKYPLFILKNCWYKSYINCDRPHPPKGPLGGSTFWILRSCNDQILLKIVLVEHRDKRIFLVECLADRPKFRPHSHKWNFKTWQNVGWKFKKCALFLVKCDSRCHIMPKKTTFKLCI